MKRQPVITGLGIVSPIGVGAAAFWASVRDAASGIRHASRLDLAGLPRECRIVGEVPDAQLAGWPVACDERLGRFSRFAMIAARMAREDSRLEGAARPARRVKVAIGTAAQGQADVAELATERVGAGLPPPPWSSNEYPAHAAASRVAMEAGAQGEAFTIGTACAAGIDAIAWAAGEIRSGAAGVVLAGGTDAPLSPLTLQVFHAAGVLSRWTGPAAEASRPFDSLRSGLVLAEGAAIVTVEDEAEARARGAPIYARILGQARSAESVGLRQTDTSGAVVARVLGEALRDAGLSVADIDHISAHGNAMRDYDIAETAGIKRVFGPAAWSVPVSSLKSMCGQALAASSAIQVVGACLTLRDQLIPPTINYKVPDPRCDLDYVPNRARAGRVRTVLIHAHGLGGTHSALVLARPD